MKKFLIIVLIFYYNFITKGKVFSKIEEKFIPSKDHIKENLSKYYYIEINNKKKDFNKKNYIILKMISGFSVSCKKNILKEGYSCTIGYNFMKLFDIYERRKENKRQISKIKREITHGFYDRLNNILKEREELIKQVFIYNKLVDIFDLKQKIFLIEQKKYQNGEIKPSEFFKRKISFEIDKLKLEEMDFDLKKLKNEILMKSKKNYNFQKDLFINCKM